MGPPLLITAYRFTVGGRMHGFDVAHEDAVHAPAVHLLHGQHQADFWKFENHPGGGHHAQHAENHAAERVEIPLGKGHGHQVGDIHQRRPPTDAIRIFVHLLPFPDGFIGIILVVALFGFNTISNVSNRAQDWNRADETIEDKIAANLPGNNETPMTITIGAGANSYNITGVLRTYVEDGKSITVFVPN